MAPPVDSSTGVQPFGDNALIGATQTDAARVHQAMNSGLRPVPNERALDDWIHSGIMAISVYAWEAAAKSESLTFYDNCLTVLIAIWEKNREALIQALREDRTPSPAASMYLGGDANDGGRAYRGLRPRQHMDWIDLEGHIHGSMLLISLAAWDESIRQNSTQFFDRHFANAIDNWNRNRLMAVVVVQR